MTEALSYLRVIELCDDIPGAACARQFAGCGADVLFLEPPSGAPLRRLPPLGNNILDTLARNRVAYWTAMGWAEPAYTPEEFDAAGDALRSGPRGDWYEFHRALGVVNNWRSSHAFPLNTFQNGLRNKARNIDASAIIAQRIKRLPTIMRKLNRRKDLKLTEIQDIGGCRAIMSDVRGVRRLAEGYKGSSIKHRFEHEDNYINRPRRTGYRSVHLIYRYYSDRKSTYNDMKIEIQIRSSLQHAWATAVETVGLFTGQFLKNQEGDKDWLKFFALMGSAIAIKEDCPIVDRTPEDPGKLYSAIREYEEKLDVINRLEAYGDALRIMNPGGQGAEFFLLELDPASRSLQITSYRRGELESASLAYLAAEQGNADQPRDPERDGGDSRS